LYEDVKVSGKTLTAGQYDLAWEGTGANVQLSIRQGKDTIATVPAQLENSASAPANTGYSIKKEDDGSKSLTSVFFSGKKYSLNLDQPAALLTYLPRPQFPLQVTSNFASFLYTIRGLHSPRESLPTVLACLRVRGRFFRFVDSSNRFTACRNVHGVVTRLLLPLRAYNLSHCELHTENSFETFAVEEAWHADFSSIFRAFVSPDRIFPWCASCPAESR